jgi:hypothetical protein
MLVLAHGSKQPIDPMGKWLQTSNGHPI